MIFMVIFIIVIYFILLDELMMASVQRRIGPSNLGFYGVIAPILNGVNLIIAQTLIPKLALSNYRLSIILFFFLSLASFAFLPPFFSVDCEGSILIYIGIGGLIIFLLVYSSFSGQSKYSILGAVRVCIQLLSYELILTCLLLFFT